MVIRVGAGIRLPDRGTEKWKGLAGPASEARSRSASARGATCCWRSGSDQRDITRGGRGGEQVRGGNGSDRLVGNAGTDLVSCASGRDSAVVDRDDRTVGCESVLRTR